jgi:plasmid stabilization system protein ParE
VTRFGFTPHAEADINELTHYLRGLPRIPALRIGRQIQQAIANIAAFPYHAPLDERLTRITDYEVHRLVCGDYLLFYHPGESLSLILGVLHGRRDIDTTMRDRLR